MREAPNRRTRKSMTHKACDPRIPTAHIEIRSGLSIQMPTSVSSKAMSQKYRKLVGP